MARRVRLWVDHTKCVGSTICTQIAPKVFSLNENRQSTVVNPEGDTAARIKEAAEGCPLSAIVMEDAETGQRLLPLVKGTSPTDTC